MEPPADLEAAAAEEPVAPQASLLRLLFSRLERVWHVEASKRVVPPEEETLLAIAPYRPKHYLRRRAPDEIEAVLATLNHGALDMIQAGFSTQALSLTQFAEAIVHTGNYDAERVLAFIGGVVDLFLEVLRSQADRADEGAGALTVNWAQLMNHFIECPEIAMFEGSEGGGAVSMKSPGAIDRIPQVHRNNFIDRAKHQGASIEKIYWCPYLDTLTTVEGTESVYFWSPHAPGWDAPRELTPNLGQDFYDAEGKALYTVLAAAWDDELQDLVALLSNRMLIIWRLRNREKGQFQQKRELRFNASQCQGRTGDKYWKVKLLAIDKETGEDVNKKKTLEDQERSEGSMRREKAEARLAEEASTQVDIWWNSYMKVWITTDRSGKLFLWDLRVMEGAWMEAFMEPKKVLKEHRRLVTSHLELNKNKFTTTSLDRSVILWDVKNLTPEVKIEGGGCHTGAVLSQAYLPRFNMLVTVGTEKKIFVWTIDSTAFRGNKAKLSGHQANLTQVSAGQRVFFTLDESCFAILWDGATLVSLQTVGLATLVPKHCLCLPEHGTICVAGRRLNFLEGNEIAAAALGKALTKEQQAKMTNKQAEGASIKEHAKPIWCGLSDARGAMLSATEVEVRLHSRGSPGQSRVTFNTPEGDTISAFAAADNFSWAFIGTSKGALYFVKYRSGFVLKMYPGRHGDLEEWNRAGSAGAGAGTANGSEPGGGDESKPPSREKRERSLRRTSGAGSGTGTMNFGPGVQGPRAATPSADVREGGVSPQGGGGAAGAPGGAGEDVIPEDGRLEAGHRESRRPRGGGSLQNAPTPEEVRRGLSSHITCILPSEEHGRVYAGTVEGRVLIFKCEEGFPIIRWLYQPYDTSAVTCLNCGEEPSGKLLTVGMQDGTVHLYGVSNLRLAGSIHIPHLLKEDGKGAELRHLRLFSVRAESGLPLTLMTVDADSRLRLWGLDIHEQSGKLKELKLVADGGQLRESDSVTIRTKDIPQAPPPVKDNKEAKDVNQSAEDGAEEVKADGKSEAKVPAKSSFYETNIPISCLVQREKSSTPVDLRAIATMTGLLSLPVNALNKQTSDGPMPASAKELLSAKAAAKKGAEADPKRKAAEAEEAELAKAKGKGKGKGKKRAISAGSMTGVFSMTQPPASREGASPSRAAGARVTFQEEKDVELGSDCSGSDTDADADEAVGWRLDQQPREPPKKQDDPKPGQPVEPEPRVVDGSRIAFFADSGGWIWCVDIGASVAGATQTSPPVTVILDPASTRQQTNTGPPQRRQRNSVRLGAIPSLGNTHLLGKGPSQRDEDLMPVLAKPAPKARPETFKIINAWPAHQSAIVSLTPSGSPAALVSVDIDKEVKVWSTAGDLWGHFSLRGGPDSADPPVAIWPPPHVLSAQLSLMRTAKHLCKRMGFHTKKEEQEPSAVALPRQAQRKPSKQGVVKAKSQAAASQPASAPPPVVTNEETLQSAEFPQAAVTPTQASQAEQDQRFGSDWTHGSSATESAGNEEAQGEVEAVPAGSDAPPPVEAAVSEAAAGEASSSGGMEASAAEAPEAAEPADEAVELPSAAVARPGTAGSQGTNRGAGLSPSGSAADLAATGGAGRRRHKFSSQQLSEMLRNHAFSSGFQNYKQFIRKCEPGSAERGWKKKGESLAQLEAQRSNFFGRPASAFGVELLTEREAATWDAGTRGLGPRSASEGALVRYAQCAVEDMTKTVRDNLGVDVSQVSRRQIRTPSFTARLDIGGVSTNPNDPNSATAKAVRKLYTVEGQATSLPSLQGARGKRSSKMQST